MGSTFVSHRGTRGLAAAAALAAFALSGSAARATPVYTYPFLDGNVLNVNDVIGTGVNTAYLAVDFTDGVTEAFQYNFNGTLDGYMLLKDVEAGSTLQDTESDKYLVEFGSHEILGVTDGANTTSVDPNDPSLYFTPPRDDSTTTGTLYPVADEYTTTSSQGVTYEQSPVGIDQLNVISGELLAFDTTNDDFSSAAPILPETAAVAVPEPATLASATVVTTCALLRRRRRRAARA